MLKYLNPSYYLRAAQRGGYTIDQTILIVVIIAILITLVIVTVGWQLINRTSGTKLGSQMTQIEDAIGQFYGTTHFWPHMAFSTAPTNPALGYALVLAGQTPAGASLNSTIPTPLSNFVSGFSISGTTSINNSYGGTISLINGTVNAWTGAPSTSQYLIVQFAGVPLTDAQEADRAVDGKEDNQKGRLVYIRSGTACIPGAGAAVTATGAAPTSGNVNVCYVASALN